MCAPGMYNHDTHTLLQRPHLKCSHVLTCGQFSVHGPGFQPASDGRPAVASRANFMHGSYKYDIELTVTGVGFRKEGLDGIDPDLTQTFR